MLPGFFLAINFDILNPQCRCLNPASRKETENGGEHVDGNLDCLFGFFWINLFFHDFEFLKG